MTFLSVMGLLFLILIAGAVLYGIGQLWDWVSDINKFSRNIDNRVSDLHHKYQQLDYRVDKLIEQVTNLDKKNSV